MRNLEDSEMNCEYRDLYDALSRYDETKDAPGVSAKILSILESSGYVHIDCPISFECFEHISQQIGPIKFRTNVAIDKNRNSVQQRKRIINQHRPGVYDSGSLWFHTDNPTINVVGWYCLAQDQAKGATLLLDTSDVAEHFSQHELETLSAINVSCAVPDSEIEEFFQAPLLSKNSRGYNVYYVPWLIFDSYEKERQDLIEKFSEYVKHKEMTELISVRLAKGECLFLDNRRMLHGRYAIPENSKRHLIRFWVGAAALH